MYDKCFSFLHLVSVFTHSGHDCAVILCASPHLPPALGKKKKEETDGAIEIAGVFISPLSSILRIFTPLVRPDVRCETIICAFFFSSCPAPTRSNALYCRDSFPRSIPYGVFVSLYSGLLGNRRSLFGWFKVNKQSKPGGSESEIPRYRCMDSRHEDYAILLEPSAQPVMRLICSTLYCGLKASEPHRFARRYSRSPLFHDSLSPDSCSWKWNISLDVM
jgi:hypothetical protein